jgi:hypothetical protein
MVLAVGWPERAGLTRILLQPVLSPYHTCRHNGSAQLSWQRTQSPKQLALLVIITSGMFGAAMALGTAVPGTPCLKLSRWDESVTEDQSTLSEVRIGD